MHSPKECWKACPTSRSCSYSLLLVLFLILLFIFLFLMCEPLVNPSIEG